MFSVHVFVRKIRLRRANWCVFLCTVCIECVCVCMRWQLLCYFFSIQTKLESQLHPMPLHCFTAYTLTLTQGNISHFPYLSMTLCVRACISMYVNGASFPCDRWAPTVAVHMGVAESHFWMQQPSHLPRIFWMRGIPVELDRLKICASALAGCARVLEHQTVPNKAKAGQSKPSVRPKACAEN